MTRSDPKLMHVASEKHRQEHFCAMTCCMNEEALFLDATSVQGCIMQLVPPQDGSDILVQHSELLIHFFKVPKVPPRGALPCTARPEHQLDASQMRHKATGRSYFDVQTRCFYTGQQRLKGPLPPFCLDLVLLRKDETTAAMAPCIGGSCNHCRCRSECCSTQQAAEADIRGSSTGLACQAPYSTHKRRLPKGTSLLPEKRGSKLQQCQVLLNVLVPEQSCLSS